MLARARLRAWESVVLAVSLILVIFTVACSPAASQAPSTRGPDSRWSAKPDAQGRYYAGNPTASLVVEEWSDFQ
ncbi:MAG: hypothetical protein HYY30_08130 [Chloroflexi bacterium]|nr:hypothetical protein [Chloroflexota bacterium]